MIYTVYASSRSQTAVCEIDSDTPQQALTLAHTLIAKNCRALALDSGTVVVIDVHEPSGAAVAIWRAEGIAGEPRLLTAARNVVDCWEEGELVAAVHNLAIAVAAADAAELLPYAITAAARQREWLLSLPALTGLAVLPVRSFRHERVTLDDVCNPAEAERWSVWGLYPSCGRERLENFATHAEAAAFAETLRRIYPHLRAS